eukprot:882580-Pelagomonas_calceolata.AAC.1
MPRALVPLEALRAVHHFYSRGVTELRLLYPSLVVDSSRVLQACWQAWHAPRACALETLCARIIITHNRLLSTLSLYPSLGVYPRPAAECGVPQTLVLWRLCPRASFERTTYR